jgi:hypothetical protein
MRGQSWYVACLIGLMCLIRFGMSAVGYVEPQWLMTQLHIPLDVNIQMPYIIRVWAIRDIALAAIVAVADRSTVKILLLACIVIDLSDVLSAQLSGMEGLFNAAQTRSLQLTAIAALVPESIAFTLLAIRQTADRLQVEKN